MAGAAYICTHCGYEGKPVKPPSDDTGEGQSDVSKSLARMVNLVLPGAGFLIRPAALIISLPIHLLLWPIKSRMKPNRWCPNCGLPLMVRISSDEGFVAKRKQEVKEGLVKFDTDTPPPPVSFGKEVVFAEDIDTTKPAPPPKLERLPSLDEMLQEAPKPVAVAQTPAPEPEKPKKPVDPDQW